MLTLGLNILNSSQMAWVIWFKRYHNNVPNITEFYPDFTININEKYVVTLQWKCKDFSIFLLNNDLWSAKQILSSKKYNTEQAKQRYVPAPKNELWFVSCNLIAYLPNAQASEECNLISIWDVFLYIYSWAIWLLWVLFGASCLYGHRSVFFSCLLVWQLLIARYEEAAILTSALCCSN